MSAKSLTVSGSSSFTNTVEYTYDDGVILKSQIGEYSSTVGTNETAYQYTYDDNGNITQIVDNNNKITKYYYDDLNQLIREDNPYLNKSYTYTYDNNGNRISKKTYAYTTGTLVTASETINYTYGDSTWGDRLTKYNNTTLSFDAIGNPLNYYNGSSGYKFTWKDGRRLATARKGGVDYSFNYNDEGIRTSKTVGGVEHTYILDGSRIVSEQWDNKLMVFVYDESGAPIAIHYRLNGSAENVFYTYYLEKNLQGDVIAVYDSSGTQLVGYTYDSWGNCTTTYYNGGGSKGAQFNPFRYRGYYYDSDLGLYYLNSRYYDSNTGRFINADGQLNGGLLGYNQYTYCENNPVNRVDPNGTACWHWALAVTVVVACAFATVLTCGGFAAAASSVALVAGGTAAATTSATVAAGAFIGSSTTLAVAATASAMQSSSVDEFMDNGNWGTVATVAVGTVLGGINGYSLAQNQIPQIGGKQIVKTGTSRAPAYSKEFANTRYLQYDQSTGNLRSDVVYNSNGNWYSRVDYLHTHTIDGIPHMPHIHISAPLNSNGQPVGRETIWPW